MSSVFEQLFLQLSAILDPDFLDSNRSTKGEFNHRLKRAGNGVFVLKVDRLAKMENTATNCDMVTITKLTPKKITEN